MSSNVFIFRFSLFSNVIHVHDKLETHLINSLYMLQMKIKLSSSTNYYKRDINNYFNSNDDNDIELCTHTGGG